MQACASTDVPALAAWLGQLPGSLLPPGRPAMRKAYPPERRMTGAHLASYLARRTYALASSTRRDGRALSLTRRDSRSTAPAPFCDEATRDEMRPIGEQFVCSVADELDAGMLCRPWPFAGAAGPPVPGAAIIDP